MAPLTAFQLPVVLRPGVVSSTFTGNAIAAQREHRAPFVHARRRVASMVISERRESAADADAGAALADIGMVGLAVMGQNLALNIADKGFVVAGRTTAAPRK